MAALRGLLAAAAVIAALSPLHAAAAVPVVDRIDLDGTVNSIAAERVSAAADRAAAEHAEALLLVINTPGGDMASMDRITTSLLNSKVPVIAYIYPPGARAASAGLFVAEAADVVAMASGTNIGSAHPINADGSNIGSDLGQKILNDAVARVRDLCGSHGRNADWCEEAVRSSVNISAQQAVELHVADLLAANVPALMSALDGRQLARPHAAATTLQTANARVVDHEPALADQLLNLLVQPDVAYLLLLVAAFGLIAEVSSPGAILPGTVGGISAILALVALAELPINFAGLGLLLFAFLLFVADIKAPTHGILTAGGTVALVLGSLFLFDTGAVGMGVDPWLIAGAAAVSVVIFAIVIRNAVRARSHVLMAGASALEGALGEVRAALAPEGEVFVAGRLWPAVIEAGSAGLGATVRVTGRDGERLRVELVRGSSS
jgi:membrane-bound serine protease (ClpP class)